MSGGCTYCGTGNGMCGRHAREIREAARRESYPPLSRDQLMRGGRRG